MSPPRHSFRILCGLSVLILLLLLRPLDSYRAIQTVVFRLPGGRNALEQKRITPPMVSRYGPNDDSSTLDTHKLTHERYALDWEEVEEQLSIPTPDYLDPTVQTTVLDYGATRDLLRLLISSASDHAERGEPELAARILASALALPRQVEATTRSATSATTVLDAMVIIDIIDAIATEILALAADANLPPELLHRVHDRFVALDERFSYLARGIAWERTHTTGVFSRANDVAWGTPFSVERLQQITDGIFPSPNVLEGPIIDAVPAWKTCNEARDGLSEVGLLDRLLFLWNPGEMINRIQIVTIAPMATRVHVREGRARARLRAGLIAWHVTAYQAKEDSLPPSLQELSPRVPQSLLEDPFTGTTLAYERTDEGFRLSSANLCDDLTKTRLSLVPPEHESSD